jgi:hypothetical protein
MLSAQQSLWDNLFFLFWMYSYFFFFLSFNLLHQRALHLELVDLGDEGVRRVGSRAAEHTREVPVSRIRSRIDE